MAEKRKGQSGPDLPRRNRPAPTIDLTATEVPAAESTTEWPPAQSTTEPPPAPDAGAEPSAPPEPTVEAVNPDAPPPFPPPPPPEQPPAETASESNEAPPPEMAAVERREHAGMAIPLIAGFVGGLIPAAVLAALWYGGVLPNRRAAEPQPQIAKLEQQLGSAQKDMQALQAQMQNLQSRTEALQNRPAPATDTAALDALTKRVAALEASAKSTPASTDAQMSNRLAGLESALKSNDAARAELTTKLDQAAASGTQALRQADALNVAVNQLAARVDELAKQQPNGVTLAQFDALQKQVASLEQATQAARKEIAQTAAADSAMRRALAATSLRDAVLSHAPYQAELAGAQMLGLDAKQLAPLQRFAASGVPSDAQLADELRKLLPSLAQNVAPQASGSFLDRLSANAGRLVRVTPANAPTGDEPAAVLARLQFDAAHGDIDAAARDIEKLPAADREQAAEWLAKVTARNNALAAARALGNDALRALGER